MAVVLIAVLDPDSMKSRRALVRGEGHRTMIANDGPSCLESARQVRPAMVLADVALPGLDGYGLTLSLREDLPSSVTRVLLMKGRVVRDDRTTASAVGADAVLERSMDDRDFLDLVRKVIAERSQAEGGLSGRYDKETLIAMLQFLHQRRVTGTLSLSGKPATVVFAGGEIIGARSGGHAGSEALFNLVRAEGGRYCFDAGLVDPTARNIDMRFQHLLMDVVSSLCP